MDTLFSLVQSDTKPSVAGGMDSLRFSAAAVYQLQARVLEGVQSIPRRGLEVCGLLLGDKDEEIIYVKHLLPLMSTYPDGPTFRVPLQELPGMVERASDTSQVVGMYRSRTDGISAIDGQDEFLLRLLSTNTSVAVLLILQSKSSQAKARAGLFDGTDLKWLGEALPLSELSHSSPLRTSAPDDSGKTAPSSKARFYVLGAFAILLLVAAATVYVFGSNKREQRGANNPARLLLAPEPEPQTSEVGPVETQAQVGEPMPEGAEPLAEASSLPVAALKAARGFKPPPSPKQAPLGEAETIFQPAPTPALLPSAPLVNPLTATAPAPVAPPLVSQAVQFVPPVLARQPAAIVIPPELRRLVQQEISLAIRVTVDQTGVVRALAPVNSLDRVGESLFRAYASAIKTWQFESATRDGAPITADTVLKFRVLPGAQR